MRRDPLTSHHGALFIACVGTLAALAAGCSSSAAGSATAPHPATSAVKRPPKTPNASPSTSSVSSSKPTTAPSTTAAGLDLSGSWSGRYNGSYSGTFHLSWKQHGSRLVGRITLSAPASTQRLTGAVDGSTITFGTVGSTAVTYSGTVSGSSMSGAFQVGGAPSGNWSATKSN